MPTDTRAHAIACRNLGKCYEVYARPQDRLKQALWRGRRRFYEEHWALRDVGFEVARGEALGVIGTNGSGKSTLLQLLAGTLRASEGRIEVGGRIAALLELGSGFNPEFTGRENVHLNGQLLGISPDEMEARFAAIESFAGIGEFIDRPVKTYSSGMFVRLAFSVAVNVEPDVLIVDEALSVGDILFQHRCISRIREISAAGTTLVIVSHDPNTIRALCGRCLWLEGGRAKLLGDAKAVTEHYVESLFREENRYFLSLSSGADESPDLQTEWLAPAAEQLDGADAVALEDVRILDAEDRPAELIAHGSRFSIEARVVAQRDLTDVSVGFLIKDHLGIELTGESVFNQRRCGVDLKAGEPWTVRFSAENVLQSGHYSVAVRIHRVTAWDRSDKLLLLNDDNAAAFGVLGDDERVMWFRFHHPFEVTFP